MATNEFRWSVKPNIPSHWHSTIMHDNFTVEIAADYIEARKEDDQQLTIQQRRAEEIAEGIIRRIGVSEKIRFTARLGSVARHDPATNRRDISVLVTGCTMAATAGHVDVLVTSADGTVLVDSRKERFAELSQFAEASSKDGGLRRMCDYLLEYHADPHKRLAPLFDIVELATKIFGHQHEAARALGIPVHTMKHATDCMNDKTIRTGRHRGRGTGKQREPTAAESQLCENIAEQIVNAYTKIIEHRHFS